MHPNRRSNFNQPHGLPPWGGFPQWNPEPLPLMSTRYMDPYDINYRTPTPINPYRFPPPHDVGGFQMNVPIERKRKVDQVPQQHNGNFDSGKRFRMDLPVLNRPPVANPAAVNQKAKKKNKNNKEGNQQSPISAQSKHPLCHDLMDFMITSQIFKAPLPPIEENVKSDLEAIKLPALADFSWAKLEKFPVLVDENPVVRLDDEMRAATQFITLSERAYKNILKKVINDLNSAIQIEGCTNEWNCFGSYLYGLVNVDSDIDLYYECKPILDHSNSANANSPVTGRIRKMLQKNDKFRTVVFIKRARVPLIRVIHSSTRKQLDISFSNNLGVRNSLLTKLYLDMSPNLKHLTLYLKEIMKMYDTSGTGRITTHILFWLIAFFMQQKKLLPAVIDIRRAAEAEYFVAGWDCSLPEHYSYETEEVSLYSLLLEFCMFYRDFDFLNYVMCPFLGRALLLSDFERLRIPKREFSVYLEQMRNPEQTTFSRGAINLQDPSDLSFNLAKQVEISYVNRFKIICYHLSHDLPNRTRDLHEVESLNQCIPKLIDFDGYDGENITQYWMLALNPSFFGPESIYFGSELSPSNVMESIRKLMELVFEFEKETIVVDENRYYLHFSNGATTKNTSSVIYFEYCSNENTWKNYFISKIIPAESQPLRVYLTCEVSLDKNLVRLFVQGEMHFIKFLRENYVDVFRFALKKNIGS